MELRRVSDNFLLSDQVSKWSGWYPYYNAPVLETVNYVQYVQPIGVMTMLTEVVFVFADHYPTSTNARFMAIVNAHRKQLSLRFTDQLNVTETVYVYGIGEPEVEERVKTKLIRYVPITLMQREWIA